MRRLSGLLVGLLLFGALGVGSIPAAAQSPSGTVIIEVAEPSGSYATGFCLQPGDLVLGSFACSDGSPQHIDFVGVGSSVTRTLAPGTYNAGVANVSPLVLGGTGPVTVEAGETIVCTFSMAAAPSCLDAESTTATVLIRVDGPDGSYATGFCLDPGEPVLGSTVCSDGSSANVDFLPVGGGAVRSLQAGSYTAGIAALSPLTSGPSGPVTLAAGAVVLCTFSMTLAPVCEDLDGNDDGVPDGEQPNVASVLTATGDVVTVAGPSPDHVVSDLVALGVPVGNPPPVPLPAGMFGFSITLPAGQSVVDVELHFPPGTGPTGYLKLRGDAWVDVTGSTAIDGDVVTLTLTDNDALDTDPAVGEIGDPGGPSVAAVPTDRNSCKADGWRSVTDASGRSFRNQGDCVSWVSTRSRNPAAG